MTPVLRKRPHCYTPETNCFWCEIVLIHPAPRLLLIAVAASRRATRQLEEGDAAMKLARVKEMLPAMRALGPYLLVELILPGGTLIAATMWLVQQWKGRVSGVECRVKMPGAESKELRELMF
jgi:hypothetical protein